VWSFWAEPFRHGRGSTWLTDYHALLSWVLSVETARRHYPDTSLVSDDAGAELLIDRLGLRFDRVSLDLNRLRGRDPSWWALGKLYAYRLQDVPFVHIDSDVYLWKRLPSEVESASVFAQSPEWFDPDNDRSYYNVRAVERTFPRGGPGWLPKEWRWYTSGPGPRTASCCGILGGSRIELIADYAELGIRVVEAGRNAAGWATWEDTQECNVLIEQMLLDAVVAYRREHPRLEADTSLSVCHLFRGACDPFDPDLAASRGYTHLISGAKRNAGVMADLEARVMAEFPILARRCQDATRHIRGRESEDATAGPPHPSSLTDRATATD
jgi:hypothetical protein